MDLKVSRNGMGEQGFSLVVNLLAAGLLAGLGLVILTLISNFATFSSTLTEKLEILDLNNAALRLLSDAPNCSCQLDSTINTPNASNLQIDTTAANHPDIELQGLRWGCDFASTTNHLLQSGQAVPNSKSNLQVGFVRLTGIAATGAANEYTGHVQIGITNLPTAVSGPSPIGIRFRIDPVSGTPNARRISSCITGHGKTAGISSCPTGYYMVGNAGEPATFCVEMNRRSPRTLYSAIDECSTVVPAGFAPAHTCTSMEFQLACGHIPDLNSDSTKELLGDYNGNIVWGVRYSQCATASGENIATALPFRCCLR